MIAAGRPASPCKLEYPMSDEKLPSGDDTAVLATEEKTVTSDAGEKEPELLNVREVCSLLRISSRTVYNLLKSGKLPAPIRIGRSLRWPAADIRRFAGV